MAYQRWWKTVRDQQGNAINGANCAVYNGGTGTLATVYDPNTDDSAPGSLANPFVTTANGVFGFMAADGEYDVQISGGNGATQQYRVRLDTLGQSADSLRSDLAATTGAGLVGLDPSLIYPANTVGAGVAGVLGAASSLALPPTIYAVVGREVSVYFDNLIQGDARDFYWDVTCGAGVQYEDRWTLVAVAAGTYTLTITAYLKGTEIPLATATADLIVKAASAGTAVNRKVLVIGDSTTAGGQTVSELVTIFSTDAMALTLIGTKGVGPAFHEGISGSTVHAMMTDVASPFAVAGVFNFANYMTVNGYSGLNYVLINLGINDVIVKFTDADLNAQLTSSMADLETMITGIHAYDANIKIGIVIPFPPSSSQDAFGVNYACGYKRWRFKRNIVAWARKVNTQFAGRTVTNKVFIVPGGVGYDTAYNCETTTGGTLVNSRSSIKIAMQGNAVHPDVPGYKQIADGYHAFLKGQE